MQMQHTPVACLYADASEAKDELCHGNGNAPENSMPHNMKIRSMVFMQKTNTCLINLLLSVAHLL